MTRKEKLEILQEYCLKMQPHCENCRIGRIMKCIERYWDDDDCAAPDNALDEALRAIGAHDPGVELESKNTAEADLVKHPSHYCREGAMECFDEMILIFGPEEAMIFAKLNAWKYRYRSAAKNGEQDIEKSDQYMRMYKRVKEEYNL